MNNGAFSPVPVGTGFLLYSRPAGHSAQRERNSGRRFRIEKLPLIRVCRGCCLLPGQVRTHPEIPCRQERRDFVRVRFPSIQSGPASGFRIPCKDLRRKIKMPKHLTLLYQLYNIRPNFSRLSLQKKQNYPQNHQLSPVAPYTFCHFFNSTLRKMSVPGTHAPFLHLFVNSAFFAWLNAPISAPFPDPQMYFSLSMQDFFHMRTTPDKKQDGMA